MRARRLILATAIATVMLLAGACGGDDDSESAADTAAPTTTTASPTTTTTASTTTTVAPATTTTTTTAAPTTATQGEFDTEEARAGIDEFAIALLEGGEFDRVDLVRWDDDGTYEIEGHLLWASRDRQEDSHFASVVQVAELFDAAVVGAVVVTESDTTFDPVVLFGVRSDSRRGDPVVSLRTVSADGDYPYSSTTDWETLMALANRQISFEEWKEAANAGFE